MAVCGSWAIKANKRDLTTRVGFEDEMLPDFPKVKRKFQEALLRHIEARVRRDPLLSQIKRVRQFEGSRMSVGNEGGSVPSEGYGEQSGELGVDVRDVIARGPSAFLDKAADVAEQLQKQQVEMVLRHVDIIARRVGNVVDGKGRELTFELFEEMLDKVYVDFDDKGQPHLPSIIPLQMALKFRAKLAEWLSRADYAERHRRLIEKKRQEWRDRESNRKLVD